MSDAAVALRTFETLLYLLEHVRGLIQVFFNICGRITFSLRAFHGLLNLELFLAASHRASCVLILVFGDLSSCDTLHGSLGPSVTLSSEKDADGSWDR